MSGPGAEPVPLKPAPRRLWRMAFLLLVAMGLAFAVWFSFFREQPRLPKIDLSNASPQLAEAIAEASTDVRRHPRSADAWGRLGMVLLAHDYFPEADECFFQASRYDPRAAEWPYLSAQACSKIDPTRAITLLERAVALREEEPTFRLLLGELLLEQGRLDDAEKNLAEVLKSDQQRAWGHLRLAQVALCRNEPAQALKQAQLAEQAQPTVKAFHVLLAEIHFRLGDTKAAERERQESLALPAEKWHDPYMEQVERLKVEVVPRLAQAHQLSAQGQAQEEIMVLQEIADSNPSSAPARISLGQAYARFQQWGPAETAARQALSLKPGDAIALDLLGFCLRKQGQLQQAVECYRKSLELNPQNADAQYQLGYCYYRLGKKPAAVVALRTAVRLRPNYADAWRELGQFLAEANDAEAIACFRRAVELAPEDEAARRLLEDTVKRLGKAKPGPRGH